MLLPALRRLGQGDPMRSMTGQGRGECVREGVRVVVELRTVNRRQAETMVSLPDGLSSLEPRIRDAVGAMISRGRCEVRVQWERPGASAPARINLSVAQAYAAELTRLTEVLGTGERVTLEVLVRCPGVLETAAAEGEGEDHWPVVESALRMALTSLNATRGREGQALASDLSLRVGLLRAEVGRIRERAPAVLSRYREQLVQRIRAAGLEGVGLDDERVLKELVIFADRSDISEELARLESHFGQFEDCLGSAEAVGRRLDFLAQEMGREINTIGSKANDAAISAAVVQAKTELERFREQAQNVE